ncbi:MAG: hypothetical protein KatS3mg008_2078 [Acidimicrobiales bacterium]|nr:MAG: hypothetical protein KatS3mg008_2078 [Acidimicrobiales bacterium]
MQPTEAQVQKSLEALEREGGLPLRGDCVPRRERDPNDLPPGLVEFLENAPPLRLDRMADAKRRLVAGALPSEEEIAGKIVGRWICDRLR